MSRFTWGWTSRFHAHSPMRLFVGFPKWPLPSSPERPFLWQLAPQSNRSRRERGEERGRDQTRQRSHSLLQRSLGSAIPSFPLFSVGRMAQLWTPDGGATRRHGTAQGGKIMGVGHLGSRPPLAPRHRSCSFLFTGGIKAGQIRTGSSGKSQGVRKTISQKEVIGWKQKGECLPRMNI